MVDESPEILGPNYYFFFNRIEPILRFYAKEMGGFPNRVLRKMKRCEKKKSKENPEGQNFLFPFPNISEIT